MQRNLNKNMFEFKPDPKPEKREKKKRKPIPKVSKKMQKQLRRYDVVREEYLNDHPICERCNEKHSDQIHHKKGRVGDLLTDKRYFLASCDTCHRWIENNPLEAIKMGFSIKRLEK
ncbi:hypothetical protein DRO61_06235 [Candidatus Bathyarchaeota archaeon]|nr:MAG: hypothetical protein DRO61_06235 [Candidatus Bathyarchaeota archaeon]